MYDARTNQAVVFGGITDNGSLNDVWMLANASGVSGTPKWAPSSPAGLLPPVRHFHTAGFSTTSDRMVVALGAGSTPTNYTSPIHQDAWVLSEPLPSASVNELYAYNVEASDADAGDVLAYSLVTGPAGMTIDSVTGLMQWTPLLSQTGTHVVDDKGPGPAGPDRHPELHGHGRPCGREPASVVNAGPDQTITLPNPATLVGSVTDDGLPPPNPHRDMEQGQRAGHGHVRQHTVRDDDRPVQRGWYVYVLRLTANDGELAATTR